MFNPTYFLIFSGDGFPGYTVVDMFDGPVAQETLQSWANYRKGESEFVEVVEVATGRVVCEA